jgi:hypothetical protein
VSFFTVVSLLGRENTSGGLSSSTTVFDRVWTALGFVAYIDVCEKAAAKKVKSARADIL